MQSFLDFINRHRFMLIGASTGLAVGILLLSIGFWRTLLLAICVGVGAYIGAQAKRPDFSQRMLALLDRILPNWK